MYVSRFSQSRVYGQSAAGGGGPAGGRGTSAAGTCAWATGCWRKGALSSKDMPSHRASHCWLKPASVSCGVCANSVGRILALNTAKGAAAAAAAAAGVPAGVPAGAAAGTGAGAGAGAGARAKPAGAGAGSVFCLFGCGLGPCCCCCACCWRNLPSEGLLSAHQAGITARATIGFSQRILLRLLLPLPRVHSCDQRVRRLLPRRRRLRGHTVSVLRRQLLMRRRCRRRLRRLLCRLGLHDGRRPSAFCAHLPRCCREKSRARRCGRVRRRRSGSEDIL